MTAESLDLSMLLKDIPLGAWVAVSQDGQRVVAFGADVRTVLEEAIDKGERDPIMLRIPENSTSLFL